MCFESKLVAISLMSIASANCCKFVTQGGDENASKNANIKDGFQIHKSKSIDHIEDGNLLVGEYHPDNTTYYDHRPHNGVYGKINYTTDVIEIKRKNKLADVELCKIDNFVNNVKDDKVSFDAMCILKDDLDNLTSIELYISKLNAKETSILDQWWYWIVIAILSFASAILLPLVVWQNWRIRVFEQNRYVRLEAGGSGARLIDNKLPQLPATTAVCYKIMIQAGIEPLPPLDVVDNAFKDKMNSQGLINNVKISDLDATQIKWGKRLATVSFLDYNRLKNTIKRIYDDDLATHLGPEKLDANQKDVDYIADFYPSFTFNLGTYHYNKNFISITTRMYEVRINTT